MPEICPRILDTLYVHKNVYNLYKHKYIYTGTIDYADRVKSRKTSINTFSFRLDIHIP
jgi:hypothetical protein